MKRRVRLATNISQVFDNFSILDCKNENKRKKSEVRNHHDFIFKACKNDGCDLIYAGKVSNDIKAFKRFTVSN